MLYIIFEYNIIKKRIHIHKLNAKPKTIPPKTIKWRPLQEAKYPALKVNSMTSEISNQKDNKLKPKEVKQIQLGLEL